jgi:hypothetical protein
VTAANPNQRFESLYYFTNNADLYKQHAARVESLVNSMKFVTPTQTQALNSQTATAQNAPSQNNTVQPNYVDAKARAKGETNLKPAPPGSTRLDGLYATQDSGGQIGPGGVLYSNVTWRFYYFMPNGYVYLGAKNAGLENLSCTTATVDKYGEPQCTTYAAEGDQIRIGNRNPTRLRRKGSDLMIGDYTYERIPKASNLNINGTYSSYAAGVAAATSSGITFSRDGRFKSSSFTGVSYDTGGMPGGAQQPNRVGVTGTSSTGGEGTYRINGYTLDLTYSDGRKSRAFFVQVAGDSVVQIGSRIYTRGGK